jgi:hypothetical protein
MLATSRNHCNTGCGGTQFLSDLLERQRLGGLKFEANLRQKVSKTPLQLINQGSSQRKVLDFHCPRQAPGKNARPYPKNS